MRFHLLPRCVLAWLLGILFTASAAYAQTELVTNGNLETRYSAPRSDANIGPVPPGQYDDLPNWDATPSVKDRNINAPANGNEATYIASDGVAGENTSTWGQDRTNNGAYSPYSFSAHSGKSCVLLYRHPNYQGRADSYMTQQLNNTLLPGHSYQIQYWLLRLPGDAFQSQIALSITNGSPVYDPYNHVLNPSGALVVVAPNIDQRSVWTLITGSVTIPAGQNTYQWVTVSYSTDVETNGGTQDANFTDIQYAVDDISIKECSPPNAPDINLARWAGTGSAPNTAAEYDVRVNNVGGATAFNLKVETPNGNGGWQQAGGIYNQPTYTGSDDAGRNEAAGFTTFHLHLKGPIGPGPGDTYRFTVTASSVCSSVVAQQVIQLPANDGGSSDSNGIAGGSQSQDVSASAKSAEVHAQTVLVAYPNPATQTLTLPTGISSGVLLNSVGQVVQQTGAATNLDVSSLPSGLYSLRVVQAGKVVNQRIEVKH